MSLLTLLSFISLSLSSPIQDDKTLNPAIDKPNIVFIMVDDLGWGNVGYHNRENPEVRTPNIDYLALHGLQLNRHYVDAECSPTRTSFQSGRLPVHINQNNNDGITDSTMGVPPDITCIADKLKQAGYSTHMVGKWDAGFASWRQIPINRGYDTSFGYLGKMVDYFSKKGDGVCSQVYMDLWENDAPAKSSPHDVNGDEYIENIFAKKVLTKIDEMSTEKNPFFLFYASHLPHYPSQIPEDSVEKGYYTDFKRDESNCQNGNTQVSPGYYESKDDWKCRSILQAQVSVLDDIIGQITEKLKATGLWQDTLIVFTTDNGGSLELDLTAGNNYPLRGGKASFLEGGIRATAFVSGGYLPKKVRGQITNGLMHVCDWYTTFSEMLGVDSSDNVAMEMGLPSVDGVNLWPLISGEVDESPRTEIVVSKNALISGEYKLIVGKTTKYAIWQSPIFPNDTTEGQSVLSSTYLECDGKNLGKKNWGCLFNVLEDPSEYNDLAEAMPDKLAEMRARLEESKTEFFESSFTGTLSCPENFESVKGEYVTAEVGDETVNNACGCWMAIHNYGFFAGPYMNLKESQINYDNDEMKQMIAELSVANGNGMKKSNIISIFDVNLKESKINFVIYGALAIATVALLFVVLWNYMHKTKEIKQRKKKKHIPTYGTV